MKSKLLCGDWLSQKIQDKSKRDIPIVNWTLFAGTKEIVPVKNMYNH